VWTQPSGTILRASAFNSSSNGVTGAIGDNGAAVNPGSAGSLVWTADGSTSRAVMWTIGIKRGTRINGGISGGATGPILIGAASYSSSAWDDLLTKTGAITAARTYDGGFSTDLPTYT